MTGHSEIVSVGHAATPSQPPAPPAPARSPGHHDHPGRRREPPEQPGTGRDTCRTSTRNAAGSSVRPDRGLHVPDHRTTPSDMARVPDADVLTAAMRQDLPQRVRRADRRHRRPAATPPAQNAATSRGSPAHRALTGPGWRRGGRERAGP
jgi:hypothetical protein